MVGPRNLVCGLIPMHAGIPFPEHGERRLVLSARRCGGATERLNGVEVVRVPRARQTPRWSRPKLSIADQDEQICKCQALGAHCRHRRRRGSPLTHCRTSVERSVAHTETIVRPPVEHNVRYTASPIDAAIDTIRARTLSLWRLILTFQAKCRQRSFIAGVQRCFLGWEEAHQRRVPGSNNRGSARSSSGGPYRERRVVYSAVRCRCEASKIAV